MEVDVAIVGAGPAGSTLAALLAGRGVKVALIDRDVFPRDKLCGEFLSYDALPILDALHVDLGDAPRIVRCRVIGARTYEFALPHESRGVSRLFFDDLLLRTAADRGALRLDGRTATNIEQTRVTLDDGTPVEARAIAGAWGRWGRFDQQLGRAFVRDRTHRNFGFKRHYRSGGQALLPVGQHDRQECLSSTIDLYSFHRGYLGVNAVEGGITNICGLVHAGRLAGHKGRWDSFIETLRAEEPRLEQLYASHEPAQDHYLSSEPVIFRARAAVEGGIFMIGDASGVIDPLTGNGMAMAVQSALVAAPFLIQLLESPQRRADIEQRYRDAHRAMFAKRIAWSRRVAAFLSRPRLLDAVLGAIRTPKAGALLVRRTRASRDAVERLAAAWFC